MLVSDSASALCKVARDLSQPVGCGKMFLHSRCMMHMFFAGLMGALQPLAVTTPLFCSTMLVHSGGVRRSLRSKLRDELERRLCVVHQLPMDAMLHAANHRAILELLELGDDQDLPGSPLDRSTFVVR